MPSSSFRPRSAAWGREQRESPPAAWAAPATTKCLACSVGQLSTSYPGAHTDCCASARSATSRTGYLPPGAGKLACAYVSPGVRCSAQLRSHCDAPMLFLAGGRGVDLRPSSAPVQPRSASCSNHATRNYQDAVRRRACRGERCCSSSSQALLNTSTCTARCRRPRACTSERSAWPTTALRSFTTSNSSCSTAQH